MQIQSEMVARMLAHTSGTGPHATAIPGLSLLRHNTPYEKVYSVQKPMLCVIVQGQKQVILGDKVFDYAPSQYLVVSVELPVSGEVTHASPDMPYLCVGMDLEPALIFDLLREEQALAGPTQPGLFVSSARPSLLDAVLRLVRLLDTPEDIRVLAPLLQREIMFRLLQDEQSGSVRQLGIAGSQTQRVKRVISLIKQEFHRPLPIERLADEAHMSPSSLHQHFKAVTAMSPLQYQKQIRLQTARQRLLHHAADAASVAFEVGYESPSQFSREYARLFGLPPRKDIQRLREQTQSSHVTL